MLGQVARACLPPLSPIWQCSDALSRCQFCLRIVTILPPFLPIPLVCRSCAATTGHANDVTRDVLLAFAQWWLLRLQLLSTNCSRTPVISAYPTCTQPPQHVPSTNRLQRPNRLWSTIGSPLNNMQNDNHWRRSTRFYRPCGSGRCPAMDWVCLLEESSE